MSAMAAGEPSPDSRRARLRPMPEAAPVIITGRPASGLTGLPASSLAGLPPSGPNCLPASGLTARLPIAPRFAAIGPPPPVLMIQYSSTCGTRAYQIDGTREYHDRQEEGAA
jgi:hypothetical protein